MEKQHFILPSNFDGLPLHGFIIEPDETPKGIVQLVHGMTEHKERYQDFAEFLAKNGYVAICHDHRGHGESVKEKADWGWFYEYEGIAIVEDAAQISKYAKEKYPNLPLTLFGHSMGSLVVRCYLREHDDLCDKLVVCGAPYKNPLVGMAIALEKTVRLFKGARHRSKLLKHLSTGKGNKPFEKEGKNAWLNRNRACVGKYNADPACGYIFTCNGYENLFKLLKRTYTKKGYKVQNPNLPIYFVAGGEDPVIGNEVKWLNAIEFLREVGYGEVRGKLYEGMRHEILNEVGNEEVYNDLLAFIEGTMVATK